MRTLWVLFHNCVAHPLLGIATTVHDLSAERAYDYPPEVEATCERGKGADAGAELLKAAERDRTI